MSTDTVSAATLRPSAVTAASALSLPELVELVSSLAADAASWRHDLEQYPDRRWWTRLIADDSVDVWLISWPTGGATDLHDHGRSSAAFTVVEGELLEVRPEHGTLEVGVLQTGQVQWVAPGVVHDVRNTAPVGAVSIHAYSPPLTQMTYYRQDAQGLVRLHTVEGDQPETESPQHRPGPAAPART